MPIKFLNTVAVDTSVLYVDTINDRVGIGTTSPSAKLDINGGPDNLLATFKSTDDLAYISFQDNNTTSNTSVALGANDNNLVFFTGTTFGSERMRITSGGNVGIGTTSPDHTLSVNGTVSSNFFRGYTYPNNSFLDFDKDDTAASNYTALASIGRIAYLADTNANEPVANAAHEFFTGTADIDTATSLMVIETNGNVGIGTTSPASLLEISQQLSAAATIDYPYTISSRDDGNSINQTGGEGVGIKFRIAGNATTTPGDSLVGASIAAIRESSSDTDSSTGLGLFVTQNDETLDEAVRVDHDGNVGIGTTSPSKTLEVEGSVQNYMPSANTDFSIVADDGFDVYLGFGTKADRLKGYIRKDLANDSMSIFSAGNLRLGTADTERIRIDSSGNVGIGTTSPSAPLTFGKSVYGGFDSENFYRIKLQDQGGTYNDVGFGQTASGSMGFNITSGSNFIFNNGTGGEIARLNVTGLGIGTTSPDALLDVGANNIITLDDTGSSTGFIGMGSYNDGTKNRAEGLSYYGFGLEIDRPNQLISFNSYDSNGATSSGTDILVLKRDGNVGIGTSSPATKLQVGDGTADDSARVYFSDGNYTEMRGYGLQFSRSASYIRPTSDNTKTLYLGSNVAQWNTLSIDASTTTFNTNGGENMRITSAGNVGIGTTSPFTNLTVYGATDSRIALINSNSGTTSSDGFVMILENDSEVNFLNRESAAIKFSTAGTEKMRITSAGNVGIGTTSPSQKLHVAGNARVTGAYYDSNNSPGTSGQVLSSTVTGTDWVDASGGGGTPNNGTLTMTTSTGLNGAATFTANQSGNSTFAVSLDLGELTLGGTLVGTDYLIAENGGVDTRQLISSIPLSIFDNNLNWTSNTGDITSVTAGTNLTGGGTSGAVTLNMATGGVGAGTYGSTSNSTKIDNITVDAYGRVTAITTGATGSGNGTVTGSGTANYVPKWTSSTAQDDSTIYDNGNVGIGTTNPLVPLHIVSSAVDTDFLIESSNTQARMAINNTSTGDSQINFQLSNSSKFTIGVDNSDSDKFKISGSSVLGSSDRIIIDSSGNVGIGTTSPAYLLDVNEDDNVLAFRVTGGGGGAPIASFVRDIGATGSQVNINAQSNFPQIQFTNTGNTFSIGGDTSGNFKISDANAIGTNDRITIDNTGNVGIGTTSPAEKLAIDGSIRIPRTEEFYWTDGSVNGNPRAVIFSTSNEFGGDYNGIGFSIGANGRTAPSMYIRGTGNVGIGTTSPAAKLEVEGGEHLLQLSTTSSTGNPYMSFNQAGTRRSFIQHADNGDFLKLASEYGGISFFTGTGGTETQKVTILSGGNVGIGTTSPDAILHASLSSANADVPIILENSGQSGTSTASLVFAGNGGGGVEKARIKAAVYGDGYMSFHNNDDSEKMRIAANGNVGIGTTNPNQKLTIKGNDNYVATEQTNYVWGGTNTIGVRIGTSTAGLLDFRRWDGGVTHGTAVITQVSSDGGWGLDFRVDNKSTNTSATTSRMFLSTSGEVGIGTTSPAEKLHVYNGSAYITPIAYAGSQDDWVIKTGAYNNTAFDQGLKIKSTSGGVSYMAFETAHSGGETMVLRSGNVGIGLDNPSSPLEVYSSSAGKVLEISMDGNFPSFQVGLVVDSVNTYSNAAQFKIGGSTRGSISWSGSAGVAYNTTSDYRVKENVIAITDGIERLKQLKPSRFNFINSSEEVVDGFIAHEVQGIIPEAIAGEKDAIEEDGSPRLQGIDQSKIVPLLTAALQEAITKIENLETKIQILENQ